MPGSSVYHPERIEQAVGGANGWLPEEWRWARASHGVLSGVGCGIFGGNRLEFIQYAAGLAFKLIEHRANRAEIARISDKFPLMLVLEQFLIAACIEYHRAHASSPFHNIAIAYLFSSGAELFDPEQAARTGYTHIIANTKRNPAVVKLLEERVRRDDPEQFERCSKVTRSSG